MNSSGKKRKKQPNLKSSFSKKNDHFAHQGLSLLHEGKRLLLSAGRLYSPNPVPAGEDNFLFQYSVKEINLDCKTAVIDYDEVKILSGGDAFQDDPHTSSESTVIKNYHLSHLTKDHEEFNKHLGRHTKKINDAEELVLKEKTAAKMKSVDSTSDLSKQFNDGVTAYDLLFDEFESVDELTEHRVKAGKNQGEVTYKQTWSKSFSRHLAVLTCPLTSNFYHDRAQTF